MLHTNNPIIKHKTGLLNLAEELVNVSKACKIMGVSRDTPLTGFFAQARSLRLADGPDEVHKAMIAKLELKKRGYGSHKSKH